MEILTLDPSASYRHLSFRVTPSSQYEKRVIVFRMRVCVDWHYIAPMSFPFSIQLQGRHWQDTARWEPHAAYCTPEDSRSLLLCSQYNMEVAPCVKKAGGHAASLLACLSLQREKAQFCDCVVRQTQSPGQLYPAHRCVLAASSPVFASILSSAGALVELQASYLSGSVLGLVLDYIYTGALPQTCSQQQYYNLLTAARHLHMDELQEALRTHVNPAHDTNASTEAEDQSYEDIENTYSRMVNTFSQYLPLSDTCRENSLEREAQCSDASPLSNVSTSCSAPESSESSVNTGICRKISCPTPQDLIQSIACTVEVHRVSRVDKDVQRDQFHSAGTVKPESWQMNTEKELLRTAENRTSLYLLHTAEVQEEEAGKEKTLCLTAKSKAEVKQTQRKEEDEISHSPLLRFLTTQLNGNDSPSQCSSTSSPSSPRPCCSAVPVIRHSSIASMAEVSTMPPYHPVSQASVGFSRPADSPSGSTDSDRIVESITSKLKRHYRAEIQDYRNKGWEHNDSSDQCARRDSCPKSNADQSDILKQDYPSSNTDHDERMGNGFTHITDDNDHLAHCDSFQNKSHTNHLRSESMPTINDCSSFSGRSENKSDLSFDDFPSKHQRLDCSDCHNVAMATAAEEPQGQRAAASLPVQDPETGSDPHCEDLCPEGVAKEEHSYSSWCQAEIDGQDSQCNLYGPKNDWYPNLQRAETGSKDAASSQCEHDDKDTAAENNNGRTYLEHENPEPRQIFTMPLDNNTSDPTHNFVGQSYRGLLHCHCLPQEYSYSSHQDSDHKPSSHPDHSDQSSDEEEVGTFASPGLSPLRQHFASTDQILLLDISTKPSELLVSSRHRWDEQKKWVSFHQKETSGNGLGDNNREHEATSAAGVAKRKIRARARNGTESCDDAKTKPWVGETNVEERTSVGREQSRLGAEVIHKAGVVEGENQPTTMTVYSTLSELDSVQAPVPSTLSVCMPSTLSASTPTNISAHLSTPAHHPFQCSMCDRSFSQRGSLNRHVRSHLGVRPFPCPRCPMTFSRQYRVSEHMRVHQRCVIGSDCQKPTASSTGKMPQK